MSGSQQESSGSSGKSSGKGGAGKGDGKPPKNGKPKKKTTQEIVPIYARLPKGPHRIGAMGVARNQRIRIHGGMIEAVMTRGYQKTSVRLVIGLAGVSRRAFYEQFSGKEDCFLETFDLIVNRSIQRLAHAYRTAGGSPQKRMRTALEALGGNSNRTPRRCAWWCPTPRPRVPRVCGGCTGRRPCARDCCRAPSPIRASRMPSRYRW